MPPATPGARLGRAAATLLRPRPARSAARTTAAPPALRRALAHSGRHLLGTFAHAFRNLGLQITGVLYLVFALSFGAAGIKRWSSDHRALAHHAASLTAMAPTTEIELALALIFLYFGISSLLRAGKPS